MSENQGRNQQQLRIKEKLTMDEKETPQIDWQKPMRRKPGEELMKNLAVAASLVLCAVVLRSGVLPELNSTTDAIMTAVSGDTLLDEQLGKLSFVSAMFPEATLVFGEQTSDTLAMPVQASSIVHAWSEEEPYVSWQTSAQQVTASISGEIAGVYHGNGDERIVEVMSGSLSCLYGNLASCAVQVGDAVESGDVIGELITGADFVMEVRRDGYSIDPVQLLNGAS